MKKLLFLGLTTLIVMGGCSQVSENEPSVAEETPTVVVSFYVLEALGNLIAEDEINIINILPENANAHTYELGSDNMRDLTNYPNLIIIGNGFEHWYTEGYPDVAPVNANVLDVSEGIKTLESIPGVTDPHIWSSLDNLETISIAIADYFKKIVSDPSVIEANLETVLDRIDAIRTETDPMFETKKRSLFVTTKPAFNYLADSYGLELVSVGEPGHVDEVDANRLKEVIEIINDNDITVVFYENPLETDVAETLQLETGVDIRLLSALESVEEASGMDILDLVKQNIVYLAESLQ